MSFETVNRWESGKNDVEDRNVDKVYNFAYHKGIYLNTIYEQLLIEEYQAVESKVLFHGCKNGIIEFPLDLIHSKQSNDFGVGFYLGETFKQAATYIANSRNCYVYCFSLNINKLKIYKFNVDKEWMIGIAYYRGWINQYANNPYVKSIVDKVARQDVIIAPIADNKMFDIISEFVRGEITDLQCEHALAATNLGFQYVLKTKQALDNLSYLRNAFVSNVEKEELVKNKLDMNNISQDKVKVARIEYRGKGQYIDEVLR